jgi:serine/threonine-protein kinase RsbW
MSPASSALHAAVDLPPGARSVAAARRLIAQLLEAWAAERFRDDAILLVSELVSNVVRHVTGTAAMRVEVHLSEPGLRVEVVDSSALPAELRPPGPHGGHGIGLVAAVAERWGSDDHGNGKRVWFELKPYPAAPERRQN